MRQGYESLRKFAQKKSERIFYKDHTIKAVEKVARLFELNLPNLEDDLGLSSLFRHSGTKWFRKLEEGEENKAKNEKLSYAALNVSDEYSNEELANDYVSKTFDLLKTNIPIVSKRSTKFTLEDPELLDIAIRDCKAKIKGEEGLVYCSKEFISFTDKVMNLESSEELVTMKIDPIQVDYNSNGKAAKLLKVKDIERSMKLFKAVTSVFSEFFTELRNKVSSYEEHEEKVGLQPRLNFSFAQSVRTLGPKLLKESGDTIEYITGLEKKAYYDLVLDSLNNDLSINEVARGSIDSILKDSSATEDLINKCMNDNINSDDGVTGLCSKEYFEFVNQVSMAGSINDIQEAADLLSPLVS